MQKHPQKWVDELASNVAFGKDVLHGQGMMPALFVIHHEGGGFTPFTCLFRGDMQKRAIVSLITMFAVACDCEAVSFSAEAWLKIGDVRPGESQADAIKRGSEISPAEAEDRKEVLMCSLTYRDEADERQAMLEVWEIERGADGKISGFKNLERGMFKHGGTMVDVLPEERPTPGMVQSAQMFLDANAESLMTVLGLETPTEDEPVH